MSQDLETAGLKLLNVIIDLFLPQQGEQCNIYTRKTYLSYKPLNIETAYFSIRI
jgi:hypothetical protein